MYEGLSSKKRKQAHRRLRRQKDKKFCFVYGLVDANGKVGYVGQTRLPLQDRLKWHFKDAEDPKTRLHHWVNRSAGVEIFMIDANATWDVSEVLYIDRYRREGHDLMNVLRGGGDTLHAIRREGLYTPFPFKKLKRNCAQRMRRDLIGRG